MSDLGLNFLLQSALTKLQPQAFIVLRGIVEQISEWAKGSAEPLDREIGVAEVRKDFAAYLDRADGGEVVFVSRGKDRLPVAMIAIDRLCELATPNRGGTSLDQAIAMYVPEAVDLDDPLLYGQLKDRGRNRISLSQFNEPRTG